jgi:mRNA interferase MazF
MTTKPGEVYRVDLGVGGKVRLMVVVSREDADAPRALSLCVPISTAFRESAYEVELPGAPFLTQKSYANVHRGPSIVERLEQIEHCFVPDFRLGS